MNNSRILIFANGNLPDAERARQLVRPDDMIVCADGGLRHALALGLRPHVVIGDLDSLTEAEGMKLRSAGTQIQSHPVDKDATDLELALGFALAQGAPSILVIGGLGDRLDQTLANISLLAATRFADRDAKLDDGVEEVLFCRRLCEIRGMAGDIVSLLPWGANVFGAHTQGLRWELAGDTLQPELTRTISNEMLGDSAVIHIDSGLLLIIHRRRT